ncbi:MAG TPA: cytochrome c3 family protein [Bryobacteraceae bacterium]|nr:cytochrome c3 family protein [Bryobacteraceae bacterium]
MEKAGSGELRVISGSGRFRWAVCLLPVLTAALPLYAAQSGEVGSAACAACHGEIYRSYMRTPMAITSGRAGSGSFPEKFDQGDFYHQPSGARYHVYRERGNDYFSFQIADPQGRLHGTRQLDYYIGSGAVARSYLTRVDGYLYEAPVSYYSISGKWAPSPGYEQYKYIYLTRTIGLSCLQCHASQPQWIAGTQNGFRDPPFLENGVACERCHGPGAAHIAKMKSGQIGGSPEIVNPAKLDSGRRDSVCDQCHLTGEARIASAGRDIESFRPGDQLSDYVSVFVRAGETRGMKVNSHAQKLAQSACKRASGDRLWCGTCHDPHRTPAPSERVAWYREKCLGCHNTRSCTESAKARQVAGDNCIGCHMPRNLVLDVEHVVYTDHSIPRRPARATAPPAGDYSLVLFGGGQASPRDLGLAYAELALRLKNSVFQSRALELLLKAQGENPNDVPVMVELAGIYNRTSQKAKADALYEKILRADPTQVTASVTLGASLVERGDLMAGIKLWQDALSRNPGLELTRMNLALMQIRTGDVKGAEANLVKAVEINPGLAVAHDLLAKLRSATPAK